MPAPRITVVGSVNVDLVARVDRLPAPGETVTATAFDRIGGGKGANQAVALARLGAEVRFVGAVGDDGHGAALIDAVRAAGVDVTATRVSPGATGMAMILVDDAADTVIVVVPGANHRVVPEHVTACDGDAVLVQLELPDAVIEEAARRTTGFLAINVAPPRPLSAAVIDRADLVIANEHEFAAIAGLDRARVVAVTYGAAGAALLRDGVEVARAVPPAVVAVDGTAAGDAFCAALLVALLAGRDDRDALTWACAAGAAAATRHGAQPSLPTAAEIDALLDPASREGAAPPAPG